MVLFIEHEAEGLAALDDGRRALAAGGVFTGHQVPFHQDLFLHRCEIAEFL